VSSDLVGSNLGVASVEGFGTSQHSGEPIAIDQGTLNFFTGGFTGTVPINPTAAAGPMSASPAQWAFGPGGSLTVSGGIAALGIAPGTPLLTGSFSGATVVTPAAGSDLKSVSGALFNVINDKLAAYLGLPTGTGTSYAGLVTTQFAAAGSPPGAFSSQGFSGGLVTTTPVPEPGALAVFTLAVGVGLAWSRRRAACRAAQSRV
jgi:hypothetical protein